MTIRQTCGSRRTPRSAVARTPRAARGAVAPVLPVSATAAAVVAAVSVITLAALVAPGGAAAQDLDGQVGIPVGDARLYPSLRLDYLVDSNVGLRDGDEVEGSAVVVSPRLDFLAERRQLTFSVAYLGAFSASDESALEFADHDLSVGLAAEFDARRRGSVALRLAREHEPLGSDLTRGLGDTLDESLDSNTVGLETRFVYGVRDARGNVSIGLDVEGRSYTNLSSVTEGRDFTSIEPYAAFGYRLSGDTRAIAELRFSSVSFDDADDDRDEIAVLGGADFEATGKLNGGFRLGLSQASFAQADVDDEAAFVARANMDWSPREAAVIGLLLERQFDNTTSTRVGEDQAIRTLARVGWDHTWSTRFSTDVFGQLFDVQRACPDRATSTASFGVEFDLAVRRWLEIGASVGQSGRTADDCPGSVRDDLEFDRTRYGVHVRATL